MTPDGNMNLDDPDDRWVASGEFVLGTLTPAEAELVVARMSADPAFAAMVGYWQDRLLPLASRLAPLEPSARIWSAIDAAISSSSPSPSPSLTPSPESSVRSGAEGARSTPIRVPRQPLWQRLGWWRALSGFAVAASLLLGVLLLRQSELPDLSSPRYLATLQTSDGRAGWIVQAAADGPVRLLPLVAPGPLPEGRSWELWTKPEGASGPTSLGVVAVDGTLSVPRRLLPALENEQLFEISLEPQGGSPTGGPTGPVLVIGKGRRI